MKDYLSKKEYLLKKKKLEFIKAVVKWKNLPKVWKAKFDTGEDMRLWFDSISTLASYQDFVEEVKKVLLNYNIRILTDEEKAKKFLVVVKKTKKLPERHNSYFSDNSDMYTWYMKYKKQNASYETQIMNFLQEYEDFDLEPIWHMIKHEFITIIKKLKRVPEYGEAVFSNYNIDVRVVYEKIKTYDKPLYEKVLIHLETYKDKSMPIEDRIKELKEKVLELGYLPDFQEERFTDGIDMFTWYTKYKNNFPKLKEEISILIEEEKYNPTTNIYMIPNFKNTGNFYEISINAEEHLDLTELSAYEQKENHSLNKEMSFADIKKGMTK